MEGVGHFVEYGVLKAPRKHPQRDSHHKGKDDGGEHQADGRG